MLAICDAEGPLGQEVAENGLGYLASWNEAETLDRFFSVVRNDPETYMSWSHAAIARGAFYHRDRGIDRCVAVLKRLMQESSTD